MTSCVDLGIIKINDFIKQFEILDELGAGEFGIVLRALDKIKNEIVAIKLILDFSAMSAEIEISCELDELRSYTDSITQIYSFGKITDIYDNEFLHEWIGGRTSKSTINFYISPVYKIAYGSKLTIKDQTEILFEIIYTILILNRHGILHNDLNGKNIVYKKVNYKRQYMINDTIIICDGNCIPILIDFGSSDYITPTSDFSSDDIMEFSDALYQGKFNREFDLKLRKKIEQLLSSLRADILLDPIFKILMNRIIEGGDLIKIFQQIIV